MVSKPVYTKIAKDAKAGDLTTDFTDNHGFKPVLTTNAFNP
jgi:hypothetical protein